VKRIELILAALFAACWLVAVLGVFDAAPLAGTLDLGFYSLYSLAVVLGSAAGNAYAWRAWRFDPAERRLLLALYLAGPPGLLTLLRALAPAESQAAAPLVPFYAFIVFAIFFVVPLMVRRPR
jgi:hypothetical protein